MTHQLTHSLTGVKGISGQIITFECVTSLPKYNDLSGKFSEDIEKPWSYTHLRWSADADGGKRVCHVGLEKCCSGLKKKTLQECKTALTSQSISYPPLVHGQCNAHGHLCCLGQGHGHGCGRDRGLD